MNWFERYGIVGGYFLILCFGWLAAIANFTIKIDSVATILGAASVLPFGYLIVVLSQSLYYSGLGGRQLHNEIGEIIRHSNKHQEKIQLPENFNEIENEGTITFYDRMLCFKDDLEAFQYLAAFVTKRFDVISINSAIILATLLAPFFSACILAFVIGIDKSPTLCVKNFPMILIVIFSFINILTAKIINNKFNNQILVIQKDLYYLRNYKTAYERKSFTRKWARYIFGFLGVIFVFYSYCFIVIKIASIIDK